MPSAGPKETDCVGLLLCCSDFSWKFVQLERLRLECCWASSNQTSPLRETQGPSAHGTCLLGDLWPQRPNHLAQSEGMGGHRRHRCQLWCMWGVRETSDARTSQLSDILTLNKRGKMINSVLVSCFSEWHLLLSLENKIKITNKQSKQTKCVGF